MSARFPFPGRESRRSRLSAALSILWRAADRAARRRLCLALALVLAVALLAALAPAIFKLAVDRLDPGIEDGVPITLILLLAAYGSSQWLARAFAELRTHAHVSGEQRLLRRLRRHLFAHLLALPMRVHMDRCTGATAQTLTNGILGYRLILQHGLFSVLPVCVEFPVMAIVLLHFGQVRFLGILFAAAAAYAAAFAIGVRRMRDPARTASAADIHAGALMADGLMNIEAVKAFNGARDLEVRYDAVLGESERAWCRLYRRKAVNGLVAAMIMAISLAIALVLAAYDVSVGRMSVGDFILVNAYILQIVRPMETLGFALRDIAQGLAFVEKMIALLQTKTEAASQAATRPMPERLGEIVFERVSFCYRQGQPALRQVSFSIPAGRTVALVGESGAGKSTVARLLLRFFDADEGRILIGGVPVEDLSVPELRRSIALVPQDTILINDTIAANIAMGRPEAGLAEIEEAAHMAGLHGLIASLRFGYDTEVGERGVKLSGGERQRIGIARVALVRPDIWILDEATSALDARTEHEIFQNLPIATRGATCLIISHRLSAARQADTILVFSRGTVAEYGAHADLIARDGAYAALLRAQRSDMFKSASA